MESGRWGECGVYGGEWQACKEPFSAVTLDVAWWV
jgi:hypothetical protein